MTPRLLAIVSTSALVAGCGERREIDEQPIEPSGDASAAAEPFYVGVWAADAAFCANAPGSGEAAPIEITAGEFVGYENRCRIVDRQEGTEAGWRLSMICAAEGAETPDTIDVDVDGDMLRLKRAEGPEIAFVRCGKG